MSETRRTYCFKLYRSDRTAYLSRQLFVACEIHNHFIALHRRYYRRFKKYPSFYTLGVHLTKLTHRPAYSHWSMLNAQARADVLSRIDKTYKRFFEWAKKPAGRPTSPPSFKAYRKYKSYTLRRVGGGFMLLDGNRVRIGAKIFKYHKSREIDGQIKTLTVKRDRLGEWYIYVSVVAETQPSIASTGKIAGFDFGLKCFLTTSDGEEIHSPLFALRASKEIRKASQNLSSKMKGSGNRQRARLRLARTHKRIANQRRDFHFKTARKLATQYDVLCFEDLNLDGMKRLWGRKVSDLGFYSFLQTLEHVCKTNNKTLHKIGRFEPSSKTCSDCGHVVKELPLSIREWPCESCGAIHHRDINAAKNILRVGAAALGLGDVSRHEPRLPSEPTNAMLHVSERKTKTAMHNSEIKLKPNGKSN